MTRPVTLVLAATVPSLGIGKNGGLPWRLKREMKFFRQVTEGGVVIMGRKTWESIPPKFRPLKDRTNVVVSTNSTIRVDDGVLTALSLAEALDKVNHIEGRLYIIGGAQLYQTALELPATANILLTEINDPNNALECDTHFAFDQSKWLKNTDNELRKFVGPDVELVDTSVSENGLDYNFTLWTRI